MERTHGLFEPSLPATAEDRAKDHTRWVVSERLLQALDRYDNADLFNGLAFAEQTGQCVIGEATARSFSSRRVLDRTRFDGDHLHL